MSDIYQLKITLRESKTPIWRRVLFYGSITLLKFHQIIQIVMGWTDSHLHQFIVGNDYYMLRDPFAMRPLKDERRYRLNQIAPAEKFKFIY